MPTINASLKAHLEIMRQKRKMEERSGRIVSISDALDVLLSISNEKEVK